MKNNFSKEHLNYIKKIKTENRIVLFSIVGILVFGLLIWELFAHFNIIDPFITSSPSRMITTIGELFAKYDLLYHLSITLYETLLGFFIAVSFGIIIALLLWLSERLRRILEPYIVVLNSLPKIALGPIIIVWFGSGTKAIVFMAIIITIIVATITMLNGFMATDENKVLLLKSMGANKFQVLTKLVIPSSLPTFFSMLKISVGMAWIGSIMGEYLVSKAGLGYLIVYGGHVFKLDLVMSSTLILCLLAAIMYLIIVGFEKVFVKSK